MTIDASAPPEGGRLPDFVADLHARLDELRGQVRAARAEIREMVPGSALRVELDTLQDALARLTEEHDSVHEQTRANAAAVAAHDEQLAALEQQLEGAGRLAGAIASELAVMPCDVQVHVTVQLADGVSIAIDGPEDVERARELAIELAARRQSKPGSLQAAAGNDCL